MNFVRDAIKRLYGAPTLLLTLAALFFAGNTVAGRLAAGHISPWQLVLMRWVLVASAMAFLLRKTIDPAWRAARPRALWIFAMGATGFTAFNTLFYIAAHKTSAVNLGIIQGTTPAWVLLGAFLVHRARTRALQIAGVLVTMGGVGVLAARGEWQNLASLLGVNPGDLMMLLACFLYACYTVALKNRPPIGSLEFFLLLAVAAGLSSVPAVILEIASGAASWPTAQGLWVLLYVAIFPSCLSHIFYIRGVELLGPGRAGVFLNLVPVFSAVCAVALIGEPFRWHQAAALFLVVAGILMSEASGRRG